MTSSNYVSAAKWNYSRTAVRAQPNDVLLRFQAEVRPAMTLPAPLRDALKRIVYRESVDRMGDVKLKSVGGGYNAGYKCKLIRNSARSLPVYN